MKVRIWNILATLFCVLALGLVVSTRLVGFFSHQVLGGVLVIGAAWGAVSRLYLWFRKGLNTDFVKSPLSLEQRPHLKQAIGRGLCWLVLMVTILTILPRVGLWELSLGALLLGLVRIGLECLPAQKTGAGVTVVMLIFGFVVFADLVGAMWPSASAQFVLAPPFKGEWIVLQGGDSTLLSHHKVAYNQVYALDLMRLEDGRIFKAGDGSNEDTFSWGETLYAPCSGTVVSSRNGIGDSEGLNLVSDPEDATGNDIVLQCESYFVLLAHLQNGSLLVEEGDSVTAGQEIAKVGNSGNTTISHLHLQVQSHAVLWDDANRSIPFAFEEGGVSLKRNAVVQSSW